MLIRSADAGECTLQVESGYSVLAAKMCGQKCECDHLSPPIVSIPEGG
jgi:hypothetical protein